MRLTIERIRFLVLAAGVLLIAVLAIFLTIGKWKTPFGRDVPKRLGINIQEEANGVTYTQSHGGNTIFKIHASKVVQLKNDRATLHDVLIELYGKNDGHIDRIQGDEFEYDQKTEIATAAGPVEITLMQPAEKPQRGTQAGATTSSGANKVQVQTSGLVFNQQSGIASTDQRLTFSSAQGSGSAVGASFESDLGLLVLDHDVELTSRHGTHPVKLRAGHAEFDRNKQTGNLRNVTAQMQGEQATAAEARIDFRDDGSVARLEVSGGMTLTTAAGSRLAAPHGTMQFSDENQPESGHLDGGVKLTSENQVQWMNGASPTMDLVFDSRGDLRHAHLERGVELESRERGESLVKGRAVSIDTTRTWRSPIADVDFRATREGRVEPAVVHGTGGVVVTEETGRGSAAPVPARLASDDVTGVFAAHSVLRSLSGSGHAEIEETTATGVQDTASGDRLEASFAPSRAVDKSAASENGSRRQSDAIPATGISSPPAEIESAELDGDVTLVQQPAAKPGAKPEPPLRAAAGRAVYEGSGEWLHLTVHPRVNDGGMELTADRLDVSQASGDAFAHGNVKATWLGGDASGGASAAELGGKGPAHAIASEAQLNQASGQATFRGHARLWQQDNSISAPLISIDKKQEALVAKCENPGEPVLAVMLGAAGSAGSGKRAGSSVVRVRGGDLWYSAKERKAVMRSAPLTTVTAQSNGVESSSGQVDLYLAPAGTGKQAVGSGAPAQVERMVAVGHVVLTSQGRRGMGEMLAYDGRSGQYVLTGTPSAPPRLSDPQRGTVTGTALIFNTRNDSVSIEGGGQQTTTTATAPR